MQSHRNSDISVSGAGMRGSPSSSRIDSRLDHNVGSASVNTDTERSTAAKIGYDQDPAQIVSMALTLSEGRRRLASGRRYASGEQGERRVISTASTASPRSAARRSIAPFLGSNRPSSRTGSPKPRFSTVFQEPRTASQTVAIDNAAAAVGPENGSDVDIDLADEISPATAARVKRAEAYFELAYEHRRLLPHLPPVRRPGSQPHSSGPEVFQKAYNPLQYVRNRKLRIWEKTPIDSEADGWHDVPKVRTWVDAVISSHPETHHDPVECVRLPPFGQRPKNSDEDVSGQLSKELKSTVTSRLPDQFHAKPIRPRSDWVTHPADLLADAYWLEQGMNKTKIQDRDNNLIYPPYTHFKFSGWRNAAPVDVPPTTQQPSPPPEQDDDIIPEPPPSALPELPTFTSALHSHQHLRHGRRRDRLKDTLQIGDTSSSRERSRLRQKLFQDSSGSEDSGSISSGDDLLERGRKRLRRKRYLSPGKGGQESHSHSRKSPHVFGGSRGDSSQGSSAPNSKRSSVDLGTLNKLFSVDSLKRASPLNRSRTRQDSTHAGATKVATRSSLDYEAMPRASMDYDTTTAPNSPNGVEWPSIAINLSPPPSRTTSPKRKTRSAVLHPFHRKHHKAPEQVSTTDFAHVPPVQVMPPQGSEVDTQADHSKSRGTSPMTKGLSPFSAKEAYATQSAQQDRLESQSPPDTGLNHASKVSTRSTATTGSDHSKVRGIFKGGRIAAIVGNEVSRVGDFIWKRDPPPLYEHRGSVSTGSLRLHYGSESEKEAPQNKSNPQTPATNLLSRSSTVSSTRSERLSPVSTRGSPPANGRPRYNNPNLPSFTSPFQKDRQEQEKKQALLTADNDGELSESGDHISRLAAQHRSASHSSRLDRLALPKLDTGGLKPPNGVDRTKNYGFGAPLDLSRSRDASDLLNTALGPASRPPLRVSKSTGDVAQPDGTDGGPENTEPADVSWRDISRAEALLYSSTVKAREIGRRADEEQSDLPKFLVETLTPENRRLHAANQLRVKKRERHIVAARNIMHTLDRHSSTFNEKLQSFNISMAPSLHTQLQTLEDRVENTMTPKVRITADKAGELSMKLTTTSTLAVKQLNDSVDAAFRRRRRGPVRLVRRVWFAGIEWTVVGLLWFIWAVVSMVQFVLGVSRAGMNMLKWLLWIS
ncbi:hypothetical protein A1O1_01295 [Capronia coronata CBS 617.96]|uniref:Uncharacterized protein n=1 Tax=Capronia coronata CBS 617.96 TaxID=1182541 RepID=W9ZNU8_9EURO|nr:uncharacterized protein A1O1_01295 [Capronia coronata CBS 617.96]EXJ96169.1 hypothetical protein A1O1_01295 [Capronia coronata CBS 617.96]